MLLPMDQITSINNAIGAQISRVDAVRRGLMALPGKLHQLVAEGKGVGTLTMDEWARVDHAVKHSMKNGRDKPIPPVLNRLFTLTHTVVSNATDVTGNAGDFAIEKGKVRIALPDGLTTSILPTRIERQMVDTTLEQGEETMRLALTLAIDESIVLGQDLTFINSDIIDLILHASSSLEPEALRYDDLIAPSGFCYFEKPIIVGDYHPETGEFRNDINFAWRGFSWTVSGPGVTFLIYTDWGCYRHIYLPSTESALGSDISWDLAEASVWRDDDLFPCDIMRWNLDKPWTSSEMDARTQADNIYKSHLENKTPVVNSHVELFRKFFLTMMRFCYQELLVSEPAKASRQVRRAAIRDLGQEVGLNMLRLRRIKKKKSGEEDEPGEGHRLDHRIVVRGHWVNQYYSSRGPCLLEDGTTNPDSHQRLWKDPYVKGPEDAPFVRKHKINALVR